MEKSFEDSPAHGYNLVDGSLWWPSKFPPNVKTHTIDVPYSEGVFVGYRWYEAKQKPVNFPFGFGLSYTTFTMSDIKVSANTVSKEKPVTVSVTVKNTGTAAGAEVVQLYVHDDAASVERPYRELKGFQKVFLQPGESKTITMPLDWKSLAFWDVKTHAWLAEPGAFTLLVGNSSRNEQCRAQIDYK
jgi:beta-glucosidase